MANDPAKCPNCGCTNVGIAVKECAKCRKDYCNKCAKSGKCPNCGNGSIKQMRYIRR